MWVPVLAAVVLAVLGGMLMGLPGALFLRLASPLIEQIYGPGSIDASMSNIGPSAWGYFFLFSFLWPVGMPIAFAAVRKWSKQPLWSGHFFLYFAGLSLALGTMLVGVAGGFIVGRNLPAHYKAAR